MAVGHQALQSVLMKEGVMVRQTQGSHRKGVCRRAEGVPRPSYPTSSTFWFTGGCPTWTP